jgi:[ribosomal protein S5]-alanine N-acetyltransferase
MNVTKDIFLKGDSIVLRMLSKEDIYGNYARWLNDAEVTLYNSHGRFPMSIEKLRDFVQSAYASNTALVLAVCDKDSGTHIGNISLQSISWVDRSAEIAFLLGEKEFWGKGVMLEAGKIMIRHAFEVLNLHRIHCGTSSENIGMQKLAEKLGMILEGVRKEALFKNGNYYNILEYALLSK